MKVVEDNKKRIVETEGENQVLAKDVTKADLEKIKQKPTEIEQDKVKSVLGASKFIA
jgi:hypothetical protein